MEGTMQNIISWEALPESHKREIIEDTFQWGLREGLVELVRIEEDGNKIYRGTEKARLMALESIAEGVDLDEDGNQLHGGREEFHLRAEVFSFDEEGKRVDCGTKDDLPSIN